VILKLEKTQKYRSIFFFSVSLLTYSTVWVIHWPTR